MRNQTTAVSRLACGSALALGLMIATSGGAAAQSSGEWIDTKFLRQVLKGIGLRKDEEVIDYRERSPLVVPPDRALPPPQGNAAHTQDPAWPKDPDVERARAAKTQERRTLSEQEEARVLTPAELEKGRVRGGRRAASSSGSFSLVDRLMPSDLGYKGGLFGFGAKKEEVVTFKGEPPRETLTEPPVGYRTPSPEQPYGIIGTKQKSAKPIDSYTTRGEAK